MKLFNHLDVAVNNPLYSLPSEMIGDKRYYTLPSGIKVPSVTTFLSSFENKALIKWEKRVGKQEAERVKRIARNRGKEYHGLVETYLGNLLEKGWLADNVMPDVQHMFYKVKPILERVNNIHYIETHLYSEILGLAGQVDLIAEFDGILSIIDHKTSRKPKKKEWIENYFLQETCYSLMYEELTGIKAKQLVTIVNVENDHPQIFIEQRKNFIPLLAVKLKEFRSTLDKDII